MYDILLMICLISEHLDLLDLVPKGIFLEKTIIDDNNVYLKKSKKTADFVSGWRTHKVSTNTAVETQELVEPQYALSDILLILKDIDIYSLWAKVEHLFFQSSSRSDTGCTVDGSSQESVDS